jgi:L-2-amino-thiazoline-4-carboxylic acid hydrolase-like protein
MTSRSKSAGSPAPPDTLNSIGVLKRREIEARVIKPLLDAFSAEFGRERVFSIARDVIVRIAREQGEALAERAGGCSLAHFAGALEDWKKGDAYQIQVLEENDAKFSFNVTRCRYAEMYRSLGIPELGRLLSCNRDFSLIEGFNPTIKLTRTQTIMEGAPHCDFRFVQQEPDKAAASERPAKGGGPARPTRRPRASVGRTKRSGR